MALSTSDQPEGDAALLLRGAITLSGTLPARFTLEDAAALPTPASAAAWAAAHASRLTALLEVHGALLWRGFPLVRPEDFGAFVAAFGWDDLPYEHSLSLAVRTPVCARVCTTNDGRGGGLVFHHEQAAAPLFPSRLFFWCETPAPSGAGGGTGICPSWALLEALRAAQPGFLSQCIARGFRYRLALPPAPETGGAATGGVGRSWRSFFGVESVAAAEAHPVPVPVAVLDPDTLGDPREQRG